MNEKVKTINDALDAYIKEMDVEYITPSQANRYLDSIGVLKNIESRSGIYLRNLIRSGDIPGAVQNGGKGSRWHIYKSQSDCSE